MATQKRNSGLSKNTVEAKKAEAASKAAEAEAARAQTDAKRLEIEAADRAAERADKRREADKAPLEQARQIALIAGPLAAGMLYGKHKAELIAKEVASAAVAKNKGLVTVASKLRGAKSAARLRAGVSTVDKLALTKVKGPVGGLGAAFLVTEAVAARVVGANSENETAKEVLNGAAIGLGAAAVGQVSTRLVQRATTSLLPNAGAVMEVETARETLKLKPSVASQVVKSGVGKVAAKLVLPVVAGVAAVAAYNDAASAGESTVAATKEGAKAATDIVTAGAVSEYDKAKSRGAGDAEAAAIGATKGAINWATFGIADAADQALRDSGAGGVAGFVTKTAEIGFNVVFGAHAGWSDAARDASADGRPSDKVSGYASGLLGSAGVGIGIAEWQDAARLPGKLKAVALVGAGLTAWAMAAKSFIGESGPSGKAYLNPGAQSKAMQLPAKPKSSPAMVAQPLRSDGETAAYTRRSSTGLTVRVNSYRTPGR